MTGSLEVSPKEAQTRLAEEGQAVIIDVREPQEFAAARISGSELIPMRNIPAELQRLETLSDKQTLLVLCHHGVRSLQVVAWLREQGVAECYSIAGGIDQWSREIDPSVPLY